MPRVYVVYVVQVCTVVVCISYICNQYLNIQSMCCWSKLYVHCCIFEVYVACVTQACQAVVCVCSQESAKSMPWIIEWKALSAPNRHVRWIHVSQVPDNVREIALLTGRQIREPDGCRQPMGRSHTGGKVFTAKCLFSFWCSNTDAHNKAHTNTDAHASTNTHTTGTKRHHTNIKTTSERIKPTITHPRFF